METKDCVNPKGNYTFTQYVQTLNNPVLKFCLGDDLFSQTFNAQWVVINFYFTSQIQLITKPAGEILVFRDQSLSPT